MRKIHESERKNSILEKTRNELHDEVSKSEERIQKTFEMLQKRLADEGQEVGG